MTEISTSAALIDAAEAAFAQRGVDEASLRAIMRSAGADPGSIHYHFGNREALARAVLERILGPLNGRRLELLAAAEFRAESSGAKATPDVPAAGGKPPGVPLAELLEALIRPDIEAATELHGRGQGRARLIGSVYLRPSLFVKALVEAHFEPVAQRFMPHLLHAVPHVPAALLAWRIRWAVFGLLGALLSDEDEPFATEVDALVAQIVTTTTGAVTAPVPEEGPPWK